MNLLLRRGQRPALIGGKPVFTLDVRADITPEEKALVFKYKLGDTMLYQSHEITGGSGLLGVASKLAFKAVTINVSVDDLANGKRIECKDIVEMLAIEDHIKQAAKTFVEVLVAAASFGGEEAVAL